MAAIRQFQVGNGPAATKIDQNKVMGRSVAMNNRLRILTASAALLLSSAAMAQQPWPSKPVQFIVPSAAGSGPDVTLRPYTEKIAKSIGQPVVVLNRPGAQGAIGAQAAAKEPPDGYTFMLSN